MQQERICAEQEQELAQQERHLEEMTQRYQEITKKSHLESRMYVIARLQGKVWPKSPEVPPKPLERRIESSESSEEEEVQNILQKAFAAGWQAKLKAKGL